MNFLLVLKKIHPTTKNKFWTFGGGGGDNVIKLTNVIINAIFVSVH